MTEIVPKILFYEIRKNYIIYFLDMLTVADKNMQVQQKRMSYSLEQSEEEFNVLEEIEILTVTLRGYGSQIKARGWIENQQSVISYLQELQIFDIPSIHQFLLSSNLDFDQIKTYILMLNELRTQILLYLQEVQNIPA